MNTLGDPDEDRARPSVWPVYVMAGVIGLCGILYLVAVWERNQEMLMRLRDNGLLLITIFVVGGLPGYLSIATAYGLLRLRPWGWWCAGTWTVVVGCTTGSGVLDGAVVVLRGPPLASCIISPELIGFLLGWVLLMALLVWTLATRRRLFFPPKPEDEG